MVGAGVSACRQPKRLRRRRRGGCRQVGAASGLRRPGAPLQLGEPRACGDLPGAPAAARRPAAPGDAAASPADGQPWRRLRLMVDGTVLRGGRRRRPVGDVVAVDARQPRNLARGRADGRGGDSPFGASRHHGGAVPGGPAGPGGAANRSVPDFGRWREHSGNRRQEFWPTRNLAVDSRNAHATAQNPGRTLNPLDPTSAPVGGRRSEFSPNRIHIGWRQTGL